MNSQDPWRQRLSHRDLQPLRPYESSPWSRLREPSVVLTLVALVLTIALSSSRHSIAFGRVYNRLWDPIIRTIAFITPASIVFYVEARVNPSPLPARMLAIRYGTHEAKTEAVARLLGADSPAGLINSLTFVGKRKVSGMLAPRRSDKPAGMGNLSYSCYQNSVLQGLASLGPVREYLGDILTDGSSGLPRLRITEALARLVEDLYDQARNGSTLWTPPILKNMSTFQQQDAQEYYSRLLDEVRDEIHKALKAAEKKPGFEGECSDKDETAASQHSEDSGYQSNSSSVLRAFERHEALQIPLEGLTGERVECTVCSRSSGLKLQSFFCLTLNPGFEQLSYDIHELLNSFVEAERLESVQCSRCTLLTYRDKITKLIAATKDASGPQAEKSRQDWQQRLQPVEEALEDDDSDDDTLSKKCRIGPKNRVKSTKTKQMGIARPPRSLALHINRSLYDPLTGRVAKNSRPVTFPRLLDLGRWCLGSASSQQPERTRSPSLATAHADTGGGTDAPDDKEEWQLPPQMPIVAGAQQASRLTGPMYELRAVVTHYGSHESGHYICYRKHPALKENKTSTSEPKEESKPANLAADGGNDGGEDVQSEGGDGIHGNVEETKDTAASAPDTESHWWRLSDQDVTMVTEAQVLSQAGVFMLFYDRVDPASVLIANSSSESADSSYVDIDDDLREYLEAKEALLAMSAREAAPDPGLDRPGTPVELEVGDSINVVGDEILAATRSVIRPPETSVENVGAEPGLPVESSIEVAYGDESKAATRGSAQPTDLVIDVDYDGEPKAAARSDPASHKDAATTPNWSGPSPGIAAEDPALASEVALGG